MATYNGHKNYNHWNVSLWINNDESLYYQAREVCRRLGNKALAAKELLSILPKETPDGVKYSLSSVKAALVGI